MRTVFIKIKKIVTFVLALAFVTGTLCTLASPGGGLKEAYAENTTYWIDIYREFLEDKEYLSMGQDYGSETTIVGKFYDMDQDAIPELILDNGYSGRSVRAAYIYSCVNGEVKYLGIGPSDAYYDVDDENYSELYGYYSDSGYLSRYVKNGVNISTNLVEEYSNGEFNKDARYGYISPQYIFELINELSLYTVLSSEPHYMFKASYTIMQWERLFDRFDFCTGSGVYDPNDIEGTNPTIVSNIVGYPSLASIYSHGIDSSWGRDGKKDPQGKFDSYFAIEEDWAEDVATKIYNISDRDYERYLDEILGKYSYEENGWIYSFMGGVGGPGSVFDYEAIAYDGEYFYVTYSSYIDMGEDSLNPDNSNYYKVSDSRTFCIKEKNIDGKAYWSVYSVEKGGYSGGTDRPDDNDDKDNIAFSDKYAPYPVIALKSKSNGCYVTCDIGARGSDGKYEHFNEPELHMDATKIAAYEMFYLVSCSDGSYALQSAMNRKYLTKDRSGGVTGALGWTGYSYFYKDFVEDNCKLEIDKNSKHTTIRFTTSNEYLSYKNGNLEPDSDRNKAEEFEIIYLKDDYEDWEKNILSSGEWFNLNDKGKGYWDIQNDIGAGKTDALERLGYTPMHLQGKDKTVVENHQMVCSVGVKKENGEYDIIIAFQGTAGYSDEVWNPLNVFEDITMSLINTPGSVERDGNVGVHPGYYLMVALFRDKEKDIVAELDGKEIRYKTLLDEARKGRAKFTILGHSMGGAMAQIYAIILTNRGISTDRIKGRTFNSAIAVTQGDDGEMFNDWYNISVSTDSVTNGCVPGSLNVYGVNRIGKTIWLFDNEPDKDISSSLNVSNISEPKHNMDRKLLEILQVLSAAGSNYHTVNISREDGLFVTNKNDVQKYEKPGKDSKKLEKISDRYTVVNVKGYTYNASGNKWFVLDDGSYVYSENVSYISKLDPRLGSSGRFVCCVSDAPVRDGFNKNAKVVDRLYYGQVVNPKYAVKNSEGNIWLLIESGWVYIGNIGMQDMNGRIRRVQVDCPVDVKLLDKAGNTIASISHDGVLESSDYNRVTPYMIGNIKYFDISGDEEYQIKVDAVSPGAMEYTVYSDYDESRGDFKVCKTFSEVELDFDKRFSGEVKKKAEDTSLGAVDDKGEVIEELSGVIGVPGETEEEKLSSDEDNKKNNKSSVWIFVAVAAAVITFVVIIIMVVRRKRKKAKAVQQQSEQLQHFTSRFCAKCGSPLDSEQLYCGVCGTKRI